MKILISNDDGINAEGIKILAEEISKIANTYVVAPAFPLWFWFANIKIDSSQCLVSIQNKFFKECFL